MQRATIVCWYQPKQKQKQKQWKCWNRYSIRTPNRQLSISHNQSAPITVCTASEEMRDVLVTVNRLERPLPTVTTFESLGGSDSTRLNNLPPPFVSEAGSAGVYLKSVATAATAEAAFDAVAVTGAAIESPQTNNSPPSDHHRHRHRHQPIKCTYIQLIQGITVLTRNGQTVSCTGSDRSECGTAFDRFDQSRY